MTKIVPATPPTNILIIKPSSIGDVVHTLPVWKLLRQHWPHARISWLIAPACAGMVQGLPDLQTIRFDRKRWGQAWHNPAAAGELLRFQRSLRDQHFDLVLDFQGLFRSGWFAWQTAAATRVGFANAREFAWLFYTQRVPVPTMEQHSVDRYLKLLEAVGCPTAPVEFEFPVTDADRQKADQLLCNVGRFAILCPGANWLTKRWPVQRFAELVKPIKDRFGLQTIVAGGPGDRELGEQIPGTLNLCGQTTLMQLVASMQRASLVITNDSGPMHIAAALNRPLVAIFGPTNPVRTGPFGHPNCVIRANIHCSPCYSRKCPHQRCLQELPIDRILQSAQRQLSAL